MILLGMRTLRDQKVTLFVDHDKQSLIMYIDDDTKLVLTSMEEIANFRYLCTEAMDILKKGRTND